VARNLAQILDLRGVGAERARREKFFAMGVWGRSDEQRGPDTLAKRAAEEARVFAALRDVLAEYIVREGGTTAPGNAQPVSDDALAAQTESRLRVARMIYALARRDSQYVTNVFGLDARVLSKAQWGQLHELALERRYGARHGAATLHPNGGVQAYQRLHPVDWIRCLTEEGSFREFEETLGYCSVDQLNFPQYQEALARGIEQTRLHSGLITGSAKIGGHAVVLAVNNFGLVGSSLCDEIGEKFRYAAHQALQERIPLISVAMGGGARMQEGTPSMHRNIPKVQHALNELEEAGVPHISIIADPTLGGTAISYGLRGDYMIVVAGSANIGFSGKRVVEQFQQRKVPKDFQQGSWLLQRGFVDEVVATEDLSKRIVELLEHAAKAGSLSDLQSRRSRLWTPTQELKLGATTPKTAGVKPKTYQNRRRPVSV
jgi:acetyl-CoA carboxylase carboxyl transferase subunit beta